MKNVITGLVISALTCSAFATSSVTNPVAKKDIGAPTYIMSEERGGMFVTRLEDSQIDDCISSDERATTNIIVERYRKMNPHRATEIDAGVLTFFPMGGRLYKDIYTNNFVDLDSSSGILDWGCTNHTYNGHNGNDTGLRSFDEQLIGVPAFAAMDGVVIYSHDGEFDMNTECQGDGNAVIIDHGGDLYGYYWHFKNGSVLVSVNDFVVAGEQIAEIASSGCSTGPHLHFELRNHDWFGGETIVPYAGACNVGESMWQEQDSIERTPYVHDHGITRSHFDSWPSHPYRYPNDHQFLLSDSHQYYWQILHNLPASGTFTWSWWSPDGNLVYSQDVDYDNGEIYRNAIYWWYWNITEMHESPGTWHVQLELNDEILLDMYPEIVSELDTSFNRAPSSIDLSIHPTVPMSNDVIECNVLGSITNDDPDRDVVRYRYTWKVNSIVVRDVVSAAMKDVIPWDLTDEGDVVSIDVIPSDGLLEGSTKTIEITVQSSQTFWTVDDNGPADFNTIQDAINAASDGDEILVYPGIYTGDGYNVIDLMGKSLWLHSSDGPAETIIDGEYERRGILYENVINGTIEGFTIQNCRAEPFDYGWGIYQLGGGIFVFNASIGIHNCIIDNNDTTGSGIGWGAGVFCQWSNEIVVTDCTFTNNRTDRSGGGLAILNSTVQMNDCTFDNNDTSGANLGWGGGFYTSNTDAIYANCTFTNNTADRDGAGIFHYSSTFELENCSIKFNTAVEGGGGLALQNGSGIATQCTISHNTAVTGLLGTLGAGILNYKGEITLADTTVCGNNPDQINGSWIDNGGNTVDSECPVDCPDINGDGIVDVGDLLSIIDQWGLTNSPADVNQDGIVDVSDLLIVVGNWGPCE